MNVWDYILGSLLIICALLVIIVVLMQQGRRKGISGVIAGGADTFLSRGKAKTADAKLPVITKWIAIAMFVLVLAANVVNYFVK